MKSGPRPRPYAVTAFLDDIWEVCKRHQMAISHEDNHGSFEVVTLDEAHRAWLMQASDRTKEVDE